VTLLARFAARLAREPGVVAHRLAVQGLPDVEVLAHLGCAAPALTRLQMCRVPRTFQDLAQIAAGVGVSVPHLAALLSLPAPE
jgi:hypothetical protein